MVGQFCLLIVQNLRVDCLTSLTITGVGMTQQPQNGSTLLNFRGLGFFDWVSFLDFDYDWGWKIGISNGKKNLFPEILSCIFTSNMIRITKKINGNETLGPHAEMMNQMLR